MIIVALGLLRLKLHPKTPLASESTVVASSADIASMGKITDTALESSGILLGTSPVPRKDYIQFLRGGSTPFNLSVLPFEEQTARNANN